MKIDLSYDERQIVKKALRQRVEDMSNFSRDCDIKGHKECMREFAEMANKADAILDKFEALDKESRIS